MTRSERRVHELLRELTPVQMAARIERHERELRSMSVLCIALLAFIAVSLGLLLLVSEC